MLTGRSRKTWVVGTAEVPEDKEFYVICSGFNGLGRLGGVAILGLGCGKCWQMIEGVRVGGSSGSREPGHGGEKKR